MFLTWFGSEAGLLLPVLLIHILKHKLSLCLSLTISLPSSGSTMNTACYHCLANSGTMISAHSNHAMFLYYIDRAKLVDSQSVFIFSLHVLGATQCLLIQVGTFGTNPFLLT